MEIDDIRQAWKDLDRRLEQQHAEHLELRRETRLGALQRGLRPLVWGQSLQLLIGVALATWAVSFWIPHRHVTHLLVSGILMQALGLFMVISATRVLALVRRLDLGAPVAAIQHRLADLRHWRVRVEAPINAVVGSFIWIPALIMSLAAHGLDPWGPGMASWAGLSALVGLGVVAMVVWLARRHGYGARLEAHAAGNSVQRARQILDEIEQFERE